MGMEITGAELWIKALKEEEVNMVFGYPGGQAIDLFDALYGQDEIALILPRHEQGLIHAADGYARSSGKVGVCLVTSGPGATNLVTGIATANADSVPLVCFTGQVATNQMGHHSFQEVDTVSIVSSICKYAVTVQKREGLGAIIRNAFYIARTGRPGVVLVDLPKDIQQSYGDPVYPQFVYPDTLYSESVYQGHMCRNLPDDSALQKHKMPVKDELNGIARILGRAERPLLLVGGGIRMSGASSELQLLVEKTDIPVVTTIMGKGTISTDHPQYVGNVGIHGSFAANTAVCECDVLCAIGTRLNDRVTGNVDKFGEHATLIHIDIEPESISGLVRPDISVKADAGEAVRNLLGYIEKMESQESQKSQENQKIQKDQKDQKIQKNQAWLEQIAGWKRDYPLFMKEDGLTPQKIIRQIGQMFPDSVVVTDVGQNQLWTTQFLELNEKRRLLTSGSMGTMGYGLPAALGAKLANPQKDVIVISGDGGIQMNIQELATAVVYELPVIICILNNGFLGNVRQWQEMFYHRHYSGTCLRSRKSCDTGCNTPTKECPEYTPDFVKLAQSYGAFGVRVTHEEEIKEVFAEAKNRKKIPTLIEFVIEPEENVMPIVSPGSSLGEMVMNY